MTESGHDADDDAMEHDTLLGMGDHIEMDASDNDPMEGFDEGVKRRLGCDVFVRSRTSWLGQGVVLFLGYPVFCLWVRRFFVFGKDFFLRFDFCMGLCIESALPIG